MQSEHPLAALFPGLTILELQIQPGLLGQVYQRPPNGQPTENLLPNLTAVLPTDVPGGQVADRGGYVESGQLKAGRLFPPSDPDDHWWIPTGRVFYSPNTGDDAAAERAYARQHFLLPHRYRDPFHTSTVSTESFVTYDAYDLLMAETRDALDNRVTIGERDAAGNINPNKPGNDYRVLQPGLVTDPNVNRSAVAFDALGMVVGTAVMGKPGEAQGDPLDDFTADLNMTIIREHVENPLVDPHSILQDATTRLVYDLFAYQRTRHEAQPQPAVVYTLARETHVADLARRERTKVQHSFSYSDGFGREIQKKIQAEPGPLAEGGPDVSPRWVGSGWRVFNNKGKPVQQYEPFFSATHRFEFARIVGVSPILFYDPVERVVATLHPNHTWEKVIFDPWRQQTYDVNDTVTRDPTADADVKGLFTRLPQSTYLPTWHNLRTDAATALERWPDTDPTTGNPSPENATIRAAEKKAAEGAAVHTDTPTTVYLDALGRTFLTFVDNGPDPAQPKKHLLFATRVLLDIEGNQRAVIDAKDRIVMRYDYDLLGNPIHQASMEAGERWMLNDVTGKLIRAWDSRGFERRVTYDELRRPKETFVIENGGNRLDTHTVYGEGQGDAGNHRTRVFQVFDGAGVVTNEAYDFKGNLLRGRRELLELLHNKEGIGYSTGMIARYAHMRRHARVFRSMTGLTVAEFATLAVEILPTLQTCERRRHDRPTRQRAPGGGPRFQLDLRDQLLLTLVWLRQYPTHEALGFLFGVSDSTATRILARVRPVLAGWGSQQLPRTDPAPQRGRPTDALLRDLPELALIVDSFEQAVQRPQDRAEADTWYSGKKKHHTIKTQITIHRGSGLICDMSESVRGPTADLTLLKASGVADGLPAHIGLEGDLGYVGVDKVHPHGQGATPRRKPRGKERPVEDKAYNRAFAQRRIEVEHAIGQVRGYQAVSQRDRDHRQHHPQREQAIAGLVNRRKQLRWGTWAA